MRHWNRIRTGLLISLLGKLCWFCLTGLITMVLLMWKWMGLFLRKNHLLRCWGWPSLVNWIEALTISLLLKLLPEVGLYLYKSTICPCIEYCCHVWAGAPSCYLELLDKVQKQICRIVGPNFAASLEPLANRQNVASLKLVFAIFCQFFISSCLDEMKINVDSFWRAIIWWINKNLIKNGRHKLSVFLTHVGNRQMLT